MAVSVTCPACKSNFSLTDDIVGKKIRCKSCKEVFTAVVDKVGAGARGKDDRIQTKPGGAKAVVRGDDDDAPRRRSPKSAESAGKGGVVVIASVAGVLLAGMAGVTFWALNREPEPVTPVATYTPPPKVIEDKPKVVEDKPKVVEDKPKEPPAAAPMNVVPAPGGYRKPRPAIFNQEAIAKVERSTVYIKVTDAEGQASGSGWVAEKFGNERYIVTNSHVVGMKEAAKPPPQKIEVIFHSGTPEEKICDGKLLALDREEDLAVISVKAPDLPEPMTIVPSYDLQITEKLLILGFPLGGNLTQIVSGLANQKMMTTLKSRESSVAGRIFQKDGSVKYIQVEGGADHGNSGGPVVDTNGHVVAILVAGLDGTTLRWVIPSEYATHLLNGRVLKIVPGQAIRSGAGIRQPITAAVADPLKRIRAVDAVVWAGQKPDPRPGKIRVRPATDREPEKMKGDGEPVVASLGYNADEVVKIGDSHIVKGELSLPALKDDEVYWFRPHYVGKDGKERWGEAVVVEMGRYPVDAKSAALFVKHKADGRDEMRKVELESRQVQGIELEGLGNMGSDTGLKAWITERTRLVEANGDARVSLKYDDIKLTDKDKDDAYRTQLRGVLEQIKNLETDLTISKDGNIRKIDPRMATVSPNARFIIGPFNAQITEALHAMSINLPNKDVAPGETWTVDTHHTIVFQKNKEGALFKLTCRYVGSRVRDGREEAVIEISGDVAKDPNATNTGGGSGGGKPGRGGAGGGSSSSSQEGEEGEKRGLAGRAYGAAVVDIATGHILLSRIESDVVVRTSASIKGRNNEEVDVNVNIGLYLETVMRRTFGKVAPKDEINYEAVLPFVPKSYNPLVGVGAPVTSSEPSTSTAPVIGQTTNFKSGAHDRVTKASAYIEVNTHQGTSSGSGWMAEPGLVVTNAHVVGMLEKAARPPVKITVVLDAGTETARTFVGKLLTVDREDDLAVIRIEGDNLPEPLKVVSSASLKSADKLSIVGFPKGKGLMEELGQGLGVRDLKTSVKVRSTSVAGRIHAEDQSVKYIQFEGGADHGNSGGPIVDSDGYVRSILDAGKDGTNIRWGIPGEYAARLLQGCPLELKPGLAYMDGSQPKMLIEAILGDPMGRVSKMAIDVWVGPQGKVRQPSETQPKAESGDSPHLSHELKYDVATQTAKGEIPLPPVSTGEVYWIQPRYVNGTGKEQWGKAMWLVSDGPPVERRKVSLASKPGAKGTERQAELSSTSHFHWNYLGNSFDEGNPLRARFIERFLGVDKKSGTSSVEIQYNDLIWDLPIRTGSARADSEIRTLLRQYTSLIKGVITVVKIAADGKMKSHQTNYNRVPFQAQSLIGTFNEQLIQSISTLSIPLPNAEVDYGHLWKSPANLFVDNRRGYDAALFEMSFRYVGVRERGGRLEAVVEIRGNLTANKDVKSVDAADLNKTPPPAETKTDPDMREFSPRLANPIDKPAGKKALYGFARGYALVDVAGGFVSEVRLVLDLDVEITVKDPTSKTDVPVPAGVEMNLHLKRFPK